MIHSTLNIQFHVLLSVYELHNRVAVSDYYLYLKSHSENKQKTVNNITLYAQTVKNY